MTAGPDVEFVGPFELWEVVVNGHAVPFLTANPLENGGIHLCLDRRLGLDLTASEALAFVPFLADSIAVAGGRTCHPCEEAPEPPLRPAAVPIHGLPAAARLV